MADQDYTGVEGLTYPGNGQKLFQEDFETEQSSIGEEVIDRESDFFSPGIIQGFAVTASGTPGCVDVEAGKARDQEGRRITKAATAAFSVPDGQTVKIIVRHLWVDEEYTPAAGAEPKQRRRHSAETAYIANGATPSDRELELARVTRSGSSVTIDADLRVFVAFGCLVGSNEIIADQIIERTADSGVPVEGILLRDGAMLNNIIVSSGTQQMISNREYLVNHTDQVVFTLPAAARAGEIIKVRDINGFGFRINQNSGQSIIIMGQSTTQGITGYIATMTGYSSIELECIIENTKWMVLNNGDFVRQ